MAPNYEEIFKDRSEYGGEAGPQYRAPSGLPRELSVRERARLLRSEGITDQPFPTDPEIPFETGTRVR